MTCDNKSQHLAYETNYSQLVWTLDRGFIVRATADIPGGLVICAYTGDVDCACYRARSDEDAILICIIWTAKEIEKHARVLELCSIRANIDRYFSSANNSSDESLQMVNIKSEVVHDEKWVN